MHDVKNQNSFMRFWFFLILVLEYISFMVKILKSMNHKGHDAATAAHKGEHKK